MYVAETLKREEIARSKPRIFAKQKFFDENAASGFISPIVRVCWNYLCNFHCEHCCAEDRMDRHLVKIGAKDTRRKMNYADLERFAHEADELGMFRMVLTGGEPTAWPDLFKVIEVLNPDRHLIIMDSNAWLLAERPGLLEKLADAGVYKMQISLDSFVESEHDQFRNKPGSYARVMQVLPKIIPLGFKLLVSTCLVRGRAFSQEFEDLCRYTTDLGAMLYVTYAKPTGTCKTHDWTIIDAKSDADKIRELEKKYNITTHMTPSFMRAKAGNPGSAALGHYDGCIMLKGIFNLEPDGEIVPCPYGQMSVGNVLTQSLKSVLDRGMRLRQIGPHRQDCSYGEDGDLVHIENTIVEERFKAGKHLLPVPYGEGFSDKDLLLS